MLKWYEIIFIVIILLFIYKRAEGYDGSYQGSLDSKFNPGGRPAEIFNTVSPAEWQEKDISYVFQSNKMSCS